MSENYRLQNWLIYLIILLLVVLQKYVYLHNFAWVYTDSDQSIMWLGLKNYTAGLFHEPRYYGQSYSSMIEAFFAVPFYKLGMPVHLALPLTTSIMALTPFLLLSGVHFKNGRILLSYIILSIPLFLSPEYSMLSSMPRGFVGGLFVASFSFLFLYQTKRIVSFFMIGLFSILAYSINSNSALLSAPLAFYFFLENNKNYKFYFFTFFGVAIGFVPHYLAQDFYTQHPNYNLHAMTMTYSLGYIATSLGHLDEYFNSNCPFFWKGGSLVLFFFIALGTLFIFRKKQNKAIWAFSVPLMVLLSLGLSKVHDGSNALYFSYGRMYMAMPLIVCLGLGFIVTPGEFRYRKEFVYLPLLFLAIHFFGLEKNIKKNFHSKYNHVVSVEKVNTILKHCNYLNNLSKALKIQLIVVTKHWYSDSYTYGCSACQSDFPKTLRPDYERRTWRLLEDENKVYEKILIIDTQRNFSKEFDFIKPLPNEPYFFLIKQNTLPTKKLLDYLNIPYRVY